MSSLNGFIRNLQERQCVDKDKKDASFISLAPYHFCFIFNLTQSKVWGLLYFIPKC